MKRMLPRMNPRILLAFAVCLLVWSVPPGVPPEGGVSDDFDKMRLKWASSLTGGSGFDPSDKAIAAYVRRLASKVTAPGKTGVWDTMRLGDADGLWADAPITANPANLTEHYKRLRLMALAYSTGSSPLYRSEALRQDIAGALAWLYTNKYNENTVRYGNWWEWQIGAPTALKDVLVLMYDELPKELTDGYIRTIDAMIPDPAARAGVRGVVETGANLVDKALIKAVQGALAEDGTRIEQARAALGQVFEYADSGDGFYKDGSYVQHLNVPYTGSYGVVLIERLAELLTLLEGSPWAVGGAQLDTVYGWFRDSFETVMADGAMTDMVRGRAISRSGWDSVQAGRQIMKPFLQIAKMLPAARSEEIRGRLKSWYLTDRTLNHIYDGLDINGMIEVRRLMADTAVAPLPERNGHFRFPSMDRVMHKRPGFGFGISMYSGRILNYEQMNGENLKGWYTGSGMTYLYNADTSQYVDGFWPTVEALRLPGTTTDGLTKASGTSAEAWVGGASAGGVYGAAGMAFRYPDSGLSGRKSWFMFDDEIVALGSGITASAAGTYETVVENRKLAGAGLNAFAVNGEAKPVEPGWSEQMSGVRWAHLAGTAAGSDIGYVFPGGANVAAKRESRTGSWYDVNRSGSKEPLTRHYLTLWLDHGPQPDGAAYAYVLLPGATAAETGKYSASPETDILANTAAVHAVRERALGVTAANFWQAGSVSFIRAGQPSSVIAQEKNGELEVAVSDPTQRQTSVTVTLNKRGYVLQQKDVRVQVLATAPKIRLRVDVTGAAGESIRTVFVKAPQ